MNVMKYKSFVWSHNPSLSIASCERSYVVHHYPEYGIDIEDFGVGAMILTGEGEFYGANAYNQWIQLNNVFNQHGLGYFYHPIHTNLSQGLMTKLQGTVEPRSNYIKYSFEIVAYNSHTGKASLIELPSVIESKNTYKGISVGDIIICKGDVFRNSNGTNQILTKMNNKKMTVINIDKDAVCPIGITLGWMYYNNVSLYNSNNISQNTSDTVSYTIKNGDTLQGIANAYGTDWKTIATQNNIKDPHKITAGRTINVMMAR